MTPYREWLERQALYNGSYTGLQAARAAVSKAEAIPAAREEDVVELSPSEMSILLRYAVSDDAQLRAMAAKVLGKLDKGQVIAARHLLAGLAAESPHQAQREQARAMLCVLPEVLP